MDDKKGISPDILNDLRQLSELDVFSSNDKLRAIFIDGRISVWKNKFPDANSPNGRVNQVCNYLFDKFNDNEENALVLFLYVLSENVGMGDQRYERLRRLADKFHNEIVEYKDELPDAIFEEFPNSSVELPPLCVFPSVSCVGRREEAQNVLNFLNTERSIVELVGKAGIGKTALGSYIATQWKEQHPDWRMGWFKFNSGYDYSVDIVLYHIADFVRQYDEVTEDLRSLLNPEAWGTLSTSRELVLNRVLGEYEYLLCFDDVHLVEADEEIRRLLSHLEQHPRVRLFLIRRPVGNDWFPKKEPIKLNYMSEEDSEALLTQMAPGLPFDIQQTLLSKSQGYPQFLKLAAKGTVDKSEAGLRAWITDLPDNVTSLQYVLEEIDQTLVDEARHFLHKLSLLRRPETREALEALLGEQVDDWQGQLNSLRARGLVDMTSDQERQAFGLHDVVRDYYVQQVTDGEADREFHRRAARYYEERGDITEAVHHRCALKAVDQIINLLDDPKSIVASGAAYAIAEELRRLLASMPGDVTPTKLKLKSLVGYLYESSGRLEAAIHWYRQASEEARECSELASHLRAHWTRQYVWAKFRTSRDQEERQQLRESLHVLENALGKEPQAQLERLEIQATRGRMMVMSGDPVGAEQVLKDTLASLDHYSAALLTQGWVLHNLGLAQFFQVKYQEAADSFVAAAQSRREDQDVWNEGLSWMNAGNVYLVWGKLSKAERFWDKGGPPLSADRQLDPPYLPGECVGGGGSSDGILGCGSSYGSTRRTCGTECCPAVAKGTGHSTRSRVTAV